MSWQAMAAVDDLPYDLCRPLAYRVLVKLANVADQNGRRAWRLKSEMARELGVSERSIQRALQELQALNLIRRGDQKFISHIRGDRKPTVYDLIMSHAGDGLQVIVDLSDGETNGETQFSTGEDDTPYGETNGETPDVVQRTNRTNNSSTQGDHRAPVCEKGHSIIIEGRWCKYGDLIRQPIGAAS